MRGGAARARRTGRAAAMVAGAVVAGGALAKAVERVDAAWQAADGDDPGHDLITPPGRSHTVRTDDGAELAVGVSGPDDGPTVVLAHCWMGGREVWAPVAHRLVGDGHRVVLYDQRGHGSSTVGTDGMTIPRLGADLRAVLEYIDATDAVLAGHSMGGMTIQSLATHHPEVAAERAKAIVLVATAASTLSQGPRRDALAQRVLGSRVVDRALASRMGHAWIRGAVGKGPRRSHLVTTRDLVASCPPATRAGWLAAMAAMDLRDGIAGISVPTTVMVGTHDRLTPPHLATQMADAIPGAKLVTLDGKGHMLPLEAADKVADVIKSAC